MEHLSTDELIDDLSEAPAERAAVHLEACGVCRRQAEELRSALEQAQAADVPEPSPLCWDHLSARIAEAIRWTPAPPSSRWRVWGQQRWGWISAAAVLMFAVSAVLFHPGGRGRTSGPAETPLRPVPLVAEAVADTTEDDGSWALVAEISTAMDWDEAGADGFGAQPGTADRAALQLSEAEQRALATLLKEEMGIPPR